ncbi:hypothetical protein L9F63_005511, partial [Diploptera punctata]
TVLSFVLSPSNCKSVLENLTEHNVEIPLLSNPKQHKHRERKLSLGNMIIEVKIEPELNYNKTMKYDVENKSIKFTIQPEITYNLSINSNTEQFERKENSVSFTELKIEIEDIKIETCSKSEEDDDFVEDLDIKFETEVSSEYIDTTSQ